MKKYKSRCRHCNWPWIPDNRHVNQDTLAIEDCLPDNNIEYLEWLVEKENINETPGR